MSCAGLCKIMLADQFCFGKNFGALLSISSVEEIKSRFESE